MGVQYSRKMIKGTVYGDFYPRFFHDSNPSGLLKSLYRFLQYISVSVYLQYILSANAVTQKSIYSNLSLDKLLDS